MAIIFNCKSCGQRFEVGEAFAGKKVRCKSCGQEMRIPDATRPAPVKKAPKPRPAPPPPDIFDDAPLPSRAAIRPMDQAESPHADPEFASPWRAPAADPRRVSSKPRNAVDEVGPLPGWLSVLVGLAGAIVGILIAFMALAGLVAGRADLLLMALLFIPAFASLGVAMVNNLKVLCYAADIGILHVLGCLFVPAYSLIFIGMHWRATRRCFFLQLGGAFGFYFFMFMIGFVGVLNAPHAPGVNAPQSAGPNDMPAEVEEIPTQDIKVIVSGVPSDDAAKVVAEKLKALVDQGGFPAVGYIWTGKTATYNASPVNDPEEFAKSIKFGTVTKVDGREITVEAGPFDGEELAAQAARRAERKAVFDPSPDLEVPADADPLTRSLLSLKSPSPHTRKDAAKRLAATPPDDDRREEVQGALKPLLDDPDGFVVNEVIKAMAAWQTSETVPALISKTTDSRFNVRWQAIETLGNLGDSRAAEAIAARLKDDGIKSEPALRALGEAAEPAVLALLRSPDPQVRRKACEVLAEIGGAETLRTMRKARPDPDLGVRMTAQRAMKAIAARVGSLGSG